MEKFITFLNGTTYMSGHNVNGVLKNWEALACMGSAIMFFAIIIATAYIVKNFQTAKVQKIRVKA